MRKGAKKRGMEVIDENITCKLCNKYLVDTVTLTECLHYFCRSCLLRHLKRDNRCPKCFQSLGKDPSAAFHRDETLQQLVYKLAPEFYWKQLKRRKKSLKKPNPGYSEIVHAEKMLQLAPQICTSTEQISVVIEYVPMSSVIGCRQEDLPSTSDECTSFKRYFRCPAAVKVEHLKKLMETKLATSENYAIYFVNSRLRTIVDSECTIQDLVYMEHWSREQPFRLLFTLARLHTEEDKPPILDAEVMPLLRLESPNHTTSLSTNSFASLNNNTDPSNDSNSPKFPRFLVSLSSTAFESGALGVQQHPIITTCPTSTQLPIKKKKKSYPKKSSLTESPSATTNEPKEGHPPPAVLNAPPTSASATPIPASTMKQQQQPQKLQCISSAMAKCSSAKPPAPTLISPFNSHSLLLSSAAAYSLGSLMQTMQGKAIAEAIMNANAALPFPLHSNTAGINASMTPIGSVEKKTVKKRKPAPPKLDSQTQSTPTTKSLEVPSTVTPATTVATVKEEVNRTEQGPVVHKTPSPNPLQDSIKKASNQQLKLPVISASQVSAMPLSSASSPPVDIAVTLKNKGITLNELLAAPPKTSALAS